MKLFHNYQKLFFAAFRIALIAITILIVFCSQSKTASANIKTYSEAGIGIDVAGEVSSPAPPVTDSYSVDRQSDLDANIRVRKSIVDLSSEEKTAFVNALKTVKNTFPEGSKLSIFDQLVLQHVMVAGFQPQFDSSGPASGFNPAHPGNTGFLPWHRKLLYELEKYLQQVDPSVTIPYWDWTDPKALDVMLSDDFLGGNGQGVKVEIPGLGTFEGGPVVSGPFADWTLNEDIHIEPINFSSLGPKMLRFVEIPPFEKYPMPKEVIERIMNLDDFVTFSTVLEGGGVGLDEEGNLIPDWAAHVYSHAMIGGVVLKDYSIPAFPTNQVRNLGTMMSILSSPYDPAFWLTHSNTDRIWAEWQEQGHTGEKFYPATGMNYGYNLNDPIWPWDGGQSQPGNVNDMDLVSMLPVTNEVVTAADLLDFRKLNYT